MAASMHSPARLAELAAAAAAGEIDHDERAELDSYPGRDAGPACDEMLAAASLVQLALLKNDRPARSAMPATLRRRLGAEAEAWCAGRSAQAPVADLAAARTRRHHRPETVGPAAASRIAPAAGWYVAAALAASLAVVLLVPRPGPENGQGLQPMPTLQARRAALVTEAPDLVTLPWAPSTVPGYENAAGDVVWSDARQEGYLRLAGLPENDPATAQYQLWVVDASRDVHPVDGGVFDSTADGELIVPVRAALPVRQPAAFAVTLEKPGGVVVSDGPMLLVAAVGS